MVKKIVTWILIADGVRGRIYSNDGPGRGIQEAVKKEFQGRNAPDREINADRGGRSYGGDGGTHGKPSASDPHTMDKKNFARELVAYLETAGHRGAFDRLVVVAPPQALGYLRQEMPGAVSSKVVGEVNKDLTHLPIQKLSAHLESVIAV